MYVPSVLYILVIYQFQYRATNGESIDGYINYSPYAMDFEVQNVRVKEGSTIKLKCGHQNSQKQYVWQFKKCETVFKGVICDTKDIFIPTNTISNWKAAETSIASKGKLKLQRASANFNGLYRCVVDGTVTKAFIVEVVGSRNYSGPQPIVISLRASNVTMNNQYNREFTVQCNVSSVIPPAIIWFKKCSFYKCDINYENICYCHLDIYASVYNTGNIYLSKININNARKTDTGLYACLAVSEYGKDYRNITIHVPYEEDEETNMCFLLLFLIPVSLILIPLQVWLCYYKRKKNKNRFIVIMQQDHLI